VSARRLLIQTTIHRIPYMAKKIIVFDLGNVLWRLDYPGWLAAMQRYRPDIGSEALDSFIESTLAKSDEGAYDDRALLGEYRLFLENETIGPDEAYDLHCTVLGKGPTKAMDILPLLSRKYDLYLLSNINPWHRRYVETEFPAIVDLFLVRIYSCDVKARKPSAEIYRLLGSRAADAITGAVYFDDVKENVDAGNAFGLESVRVTDEDSFVSYLRTRFL
jgi:FMN phosphatase YigB (HAD superfamily)